MLKVWNVSLIMRHVRARAAGHVPGAVGHPRLDPRLRRVDDRRPVPDLHRDRGRRLGRARGLAAAGPAQHRRGWTRCSRARPSSCSTTWSWWRSALVDLLGHLLPAHLRGRHGHRGQRGAALVQPLVTPLALVLVALIAHRARCWPGAGSRRRACGACCVAPAAFAARGRWSCCCAGHRRRRELDGAGHVRASWRSCSAVVVQEFGRGAAARRTMTGEPLAARARPARGPQPPPLRRLHRARRDRGPVPRRGRAPRPSTSSATCGSRPGSASRRATTSVTYVRPTARARRRPRRHRRADLVRRACWRAQGRRAQFTLRPSRNFYPTRDAAQGRDRALLRGRGHQRGRRALGSAPRPLDGDAARHQRARRADPARPTARFAHADGDVQALVDRRAGRALPPRPAARHLPRHRLAARVAGSGSAAGSCCWAP